MGQVAWDEFMRWEDTDKDNSLLCRVGGGGMFFRSREELPGQPFAFIWSLCFGFFAFTLTYFFLDVLLKSQEDYLHAQEPSEPPPHPPPVHAFCCLKI